jgi:chromatin segregation and condensation protein Rec8/ScpA/Scc1 (kleisin family)
LSQFLPAISADAANRGLRARAVVASTLLAALELARDGAMSIEQEEDYGPTRLLASPVTWEEKSAGVAVA